MRTDTTTASHAEQNQLARKTVGNVGKVGNAPAPTIFRPVKMVGKVGTGPAIGIARPSRLVGRVGPAGWSPPYQQGQLDGLCGLYSAVNAIVLLLGRVAPLDDEAIGRLFEQAIGIIAAGGELASTVAEGVDHRVWRRLVGRLAAAAALATGCGIRVSRPFRGGHPPAWPMVRAKLETALDAGGVVTLMLCGTHHHYSVIRSHSRTRYRLFDSSGLYWLAKASCGPPASDARHRLATASILVLELVR